MSRHEDTDKSRLGRQRDIELLLIVLVLTYIALNLFGLMPYIGSYKLSMLSNSGIYCLIMLPAFVAFLLQGKSFKKLFTIVKGQGKLILLLLLFRTALEFVLYIIKYNTIYMVILPDMLYIPLCFLYNIVVVGIVEEFVYRIYIQGTLEDILGRFSFLAPVVSAVLFGLSHGINNDIGNMILNIFIGLVWGYTRYFSKKATFTAMVLNHGLSNGLSECITVLCSIIFFG